MQFLHHLLNLAFAFELPHTFVIAGNVATPEAVIDLENWGVDAT